MKDWQEKYPKTWEKFCEYMIDKIKWHWLLLVSHGILDFDSMFGHLLKFFSENGIIIEMSYDSVQEKMCYYVAESGFELSDIPLYTDIEACENALEIMEGK